MTYPQTPWQLGGENPATAFKSISWKNVHTNSIYTLSVRTEWHGHINYKEVWEVRFLSQVTAFKWLLDPALLMTVGDRY